MSQINSRTLLGTIGSHILAPALLIAVAGQAAHAAGPIVFRSGEAVVARAASPLETAQRVEAMTPRAGLKRILVQFEKPVTVAQRAALKDAGLSLLSFVGSDAYFATIRAGATDGAKLAATGAKLTVASEMDPFWKLDLNFAQGRVPAHAVIGTAPMSHAIDAPREKVIGAYMVFHSDVDLREGENIAALAGAVVRDRLESINGLVVEMPYSSVMALAMHDEVQWLEPALPKFSTTNIENRILTGVNIVSSAPNNLTGAGVTAFIYDGGTALASHADFGGRVTVIDGTGLADHATHVSGTVGAAGPNQGMAPGVDILSAGLETDGSGIFLYSNPGDIEADYANAFNNFGADVANNSIGTNTAANGFGCALEGDYGVTSGVIDGVVRGNVTNGNPTRIVWANGNERGPGTCGTSFHTTAPPSCAKNHITVGATNANNDSITSFTSFGPTDDDRLKPDISAPGCQVGGDGGVTSTSSTGGYSTLCGTSMAAPTVTGIVALMLEHHRNLFLGAPDPRNSTIKALLAHNAVDNGNAGPDYQFGYGSVRADATIDFMNSLSYVEDAVSQGGTVIQSINVTGGAGPIKFTLAWDDFPAAANPVLALVNDLDLVVTDPNGTRHFPWTLGGLANPSAPAVRTQEDHINNIEQVQVDAPIGGLWTVSVTGTTVPQGPQSYSLVADGGGLAGMSLALVTSVPPLVAPGSTIDLTVSVVANSQTVVPGSVQANYRYGAGAFVQLAMTDNLDGTYSTSLPATDCGDLPEFFFTADGSVTGTVTTPPGGAAAALTTAIGTAAVPVDEQMEAGTTGWTVDVGLTDPQATTGNWNRMDPQGTAAQPEDDHTTAGTDCWVTDGTAGAGLGTFDIDGGATNLISPAFALSGFPEARLSYWRWYSNNTGASPDEDIFVVEISNDDGVTWINVETLAGAQSSGWIFHEFRVADFVALTDQIRMRFTASDLLAGSVVEAAVDDLRVVETSCTPVGPTCPGDANNDGFVDLADLNLVLFNFGSPVAPDTNGDVDGSGSVDLADLNVVLFNFGTIC